MAVISKTSSPIIPAGFRKATLSSEKALLRLITATEGLEKSGKTHFALTGPRPAAFFNLDFGTEGVVHRFLKEAGDIYIFDVEIPDRGTQTDYNRVLDRFLKANQAALDSRFFRSLIYDTATEVWELVRLAYFGHLEQVMPYQYAKPNAAYRKLIRAAFSSDKNLFLLHKLKDAYVNDKRTGGYERAGFKETGFLAQLCLRHRYIAKTKTFNLEIRECRQNPSLSGEVLEGDLCSFPMVASLVHEETSPDDWR